MHTSRAVSRLTLLLMPLRDIPVKLGDMGVTDKPKLVKLMAQGPKYLVFSTYYGLSLKNLGSYTSHNTVRLNFDRPSLLGKRHLSNVGTHFFSFFFFFWIVCYSICRLKHVIMFAFQKRCNI